MPAVCKTNADCTGAPCKDGMCMPACKVDNDCAFNEKCMNGDCMLTCRVDNDCFLGHVCLSNQCVIGCRGNEDCASSQSCINSKCSSPCKEDSCGPNALCSVIGHRPQCICPDGFMPNPTPYLGCARQPVSCGSAKDCEKGFMCMEKTCKPLCAEDKNCLANERCAENGVCRPVCRYDDDCRSGEICGDNSLCVLGCRSDDECPSDRACINAKCKDKCAAAPCGNNALCRTELHRAVCTCPDGLEGDAGVACRKPTSVCKASSDCLGGGSSCVDGQCRPGCSGDQDCLSDEKCTNGVCRAVCNSDEACGDSQICVGRICIVGCRSDSACPSNLACLNGKCLDPCAEGVSSCGSCAVCEVSNHVAQCTCPSETVGDPIIGCVTAPKRCSSNVDCGAGGNCDGGYCSYDCSRSTDCGCGWNCSNNKCRKECATDSGCPTGQFCKGYVCTVGCRSNSDCPSDSACVNGNCVNPCAATPSPCGTGAECRVSQRRPVCLCPTGTQGDPGKECVKYECVTNRDCESNKRCSTEKKCVNPCEEKDACGSNAECKVAFRKAQCSCPPGYFGNAFVECRPDVDECQRNPCGANAKCTDTVGSFVCSCLAGCTGDPYLGCLCPSSQIEPCKLAKCGVNADCRIEGNKGVCFCPNDYPVGDPLKECSIERSGVDCIATGCGQNAKCVPEGDSNVCKCNPGLYGDPEVKCMPDKICTSDYQCPADKACTKGKCVDPCSLRDVCGENALCRVVLHKSRCSCPSCYVGDPREKCIPDPRCAPITPRPPVVVPPKVDKGCLNDNNCARHLMCDKNTRTCVDPCAYSAPECEPSKKCSVRNHKPVCVCKNGFVVSDTGALICGPDKIECRKDDECASNLACINFKCVSPCVASNPCSANKQCEVLEHKPVCICVEDCKPSVSICLRDKGCPTNLACVNYQCKNPCENFKCPDNTPCYVEDHKPTCKFCPDGFKADQKFGCIKAVGCASDPDCGGRQACVNEKCINPCELNNPCKSNEGCSVKDHVPVCGPPCACIGDSDCPIRHTCDSCNCRPVPFEPNRADCEEPCAEGEPNCFDGCFIAVPSSTPAGQGLFPTNRPDIPNQPVEVEGGFQTFKPGVGTITPRPGVVTPPIGVSPLGSTTIKPGRPPTSKPVQQPVEVEAVNPGITFPPDSHINVPVENSIAVAAEEQGIASARPTSTPRPILTQSVDVEADTSKMPILPIPGSPKPGQTKPPVVAENRGTSELPGSTIVATTPKPQQVVTEAATGEIPVRPITASPKPTQTPPRPVTGEQPKPTGKPQASPVPLFPTDPVEAEVELHLGSTLPMPSTPRPSQTKPPLGVESLSPGAASPSSTIRTPVSVDPILIEPQDFAGVAPLGKPLDSSTTPPIAAGQSSSATSKPVPTVTPSVVPEAVLAEASGPESSMKPIAEVSGGEHNQVLAVAGETTSKNPPVTTFKPSFPTESVEMEMETPAPFIPVGETLRPVQGKPSVGIGEATKPTSTRQPVLTNRPTNEPIETEAETSNPIIPVGETEVQSSKPPTNVGQITTVTVPSTRPSVSTPPLEAVEAEEETVRPSDRPFTVKPVIEGASPVPVRTESPGTTQKLLPSQPPRVSTESVAVTDETLHGRPAPIAETQRPLTNRPQVINQVSTAASLSTVASRPPITTEPVLVEPELGEKPVNPIEKPLATASSPAPVAVTEVATTPKQQLTGRPSLPPSQQIEVEANTVIPSVVPVGQERPLGSLQPIPAGGQGTPQPTPGTTERPQLSTEGLNAVGVDEVTRPGPVAEVLPTSAVRPAAVAGPTGTTTPPVKPARPTNPPQEPINAEVENPKGPLGPVIKPDSAISQRPFPVIPETSSSARPPRPGVVKPAAEDPLKPVESEPDSRPPPFAQTTASPPNKPVLVLAESTTPFPPLTPGSRPEPPKQPVEAEIERPGEGLPPVSKPGVSSSERPVLVIGSTTTRSPLSVRPSTPSPSREPVEAVEELPGKPLPPLDKPGTSSTRRPVLVVTDSSDPPRVVTTIPPPREETAVFLDCSSDQDCPVRESCINQGCVNPCNFNVCGPNTECFVLNHKAVCTCLSGYTGSPTSGCKTIAVIGEEAPKVLPPSVCNPSPCGKNAECKEGPENNAICICGPGYEDRGEGCRPECESNSNCPNALACINLKCVDPCPGSCGPNSQCKVLNHNPMCACKPGFTGDAFEGCNIIPAVAEPTTPRQLQPCNPSPCGENALCKAQGTAASCVCPEDYTGDPFESCRPECVLHSDCPSDKVCENRHCINPCPAACGSNAECRVIGHLVTCTCKPGFTGDPVVDCRVIPVLTDPVVEEKPSVCEPTTCGVRAKCKEEQGRADCFCPPGLTGDPFEECRPECVTNSDCPQTSACRNQKCVDPCTTSCGKNAVCQIVRHNPVCTCAPGFIGDPFTQCVIVAEEAPVVEQPECIVDDECPLSKACVQQLCVDPCAAQPCAENALCTVQNHRAQCRCAVGFIGDPRNGCKRVQITAGCTNDDCPSNEACINGACQNPCDCGINSDCRVVDHRPICLCKDGYAGDPNVGCYQVGCRADDECPSDTACHNGRCVNPCVIDDPCAINAQCYPANHKAQCRCPPGTEGDPRVRCIAVGCRVNSDCPQDKACVERSCVNPCLIDDPCAPTAECFAQKHSAGCRCPEDRPIGNPAIGCEPVKKIDIPVLAEPECRVDDDCGSQFACMENRCKQPCTEIKPCHETAICVVVDSSPFKSMSCRCKDGMVPDESGVCKRVELPQTIACTTDSECALTEACINRQCRSPCSCGRNAVCFVQNHHPICVCQEGFAGNPQTGCYAVGCKGNGDCDFDKACHNGNCVNPCLVTNPCAPSAECFGMNHEAECRCPLGMEGNPREGCIVVGCRSDSDCPDEAACRNAKCVNPCLYDKCGPRAECFPASHRANCRCPPGYLGNPKVSCDQYPVPECTVDSDCPFKQACINEHCIEPCANLDPCHKTAVCRSMNTVPMRTIVCSCPDGFIAAEEASCKALPAIADGCTVDEDCPSDKACINAQCKDPCNCGPHTVCRVEEHQPICQCQPGYDGDPLVGCYLVGCQSDTECPGTHACINAVCAPVCGPDNEPCGPAAECEGVVHKPICTCPPGTIGNAYSVTGCIAIGCESNKDCPSDRACINRNCVSPCAEDLCVEPATCKADNHTANCICPVGLEGTEKEGCSRVEILCKFDDDCPSSEACINGNCVLPCGILNPCAVDVDCKVADTAPVKTLLCQCSPGFVFYNNSCVRVALRPPCDVDKGFVMTKDGECICSLVKGMVIDEEGKCVCPIEKGFEVDEEGNCVCPPGFFKTDSGTCDPIPRIEKECETHADCPSDKACENGICIDPCSYEPCGINAICTPIDHEATCTCPTGYIGNPKTGCTVTGRTDIPRPDMAVNCLADGVQVDIFTNDPGFDGVIYVKGHSKDEMCRKVVSSQKDVGPFDFKVKFGTCDLVLIDGNASFILVVQKHPQLLTVKAQAYQIRCVYETSTKEIELGFNVSMISTAGTIANTGPPPVCAMRICTSTGREISQAEIGDSLMLKIDVQPTSIYGGFARSCYAITSSAEGGDTKYEVTDEDGCPKDPAVFGNWDYDPENGTLSASFNAFKFPSSDSLSFQCNVRVCFGRCQPVNCGGYEAFGRKKREVNVTREARAKLRDAEQKGLLREEITVQSNYIFTVERREERFSAPTEAPDIVRVEEVCVNKLGFIIALIITALLALVAVAIAVSCWLMAYRRKPKIDGPLPHPPEFPNPLFTTPEPLAEPSPDYMS